MPRKLRPGKARRSTVSSVSDALFVWLTFRDWETASALQQSQDTNKWELFDLLMQHPDVWETIRPAALAAWTAEYPGTRPESWWLWSAPELRQVYGRFTASGGINRCHATGVPYGAPADWNDRPMVESTPGFLDRLGLWLDGEHERVPAAAFEPQPFSWELTEPSAGTDGRMREEIDR
jgi:hypothetical protein